LRRLPWGRVTRKNNPKGGTTLYVHVWEWPADGRLLLPTLQELPASGRLLANGHAVTFENVTTHGPNEPEGVLLHLTGTAPDPDVSVVRLDFPGKVTVTQLGANVPGADGSIVVPAMDLDPNGGYGNLILKRTDRDAWLTQWSNAAWNVEARVQTSKPGRWKVTAEVRGEQDALLFLELKKKAQPNVTIPAGADWHTVEIGTLDLPAGESTITLKAVKEGWKGGPDVHQFRLTPVETASNK